MDTGESITSGSRIPGTYRCVRYRARRVYIYVYAWRDETPPQIGAYAGDTLEEAEAAEMADRDALHRRYAEVAERARRELQRRRLPNALEALALQVLVRAKKRAASSGKSFELTPEETLGLLRKQNYRCALTGIKFRADPSSDVEGWRAPYRPSLDRIDARGGYTLSNVRFVLVAVNVALSDWGEDVLYAIAEALHRRKRHGVDPDMP